MAPGPVLGRFFPIGGYAVAGTSGPPRNPGLAAKFRDGDQQVAHVRPGASGGGPRPAPGGVAERPPADLEPCSSTALRLTQLARYAKEFGVIRRSRGRVAANHNHEREDAAGRRG